MYTHDPHPLKAKKNNSFFIHDGSKIIRDGQFHAKNRSRTKAVNDSNFKTELASKNNARVSQHNQTGQSLILHNGVLLSPRDQAATGVLKSPTKGIMVSPMNALNMSSTEKVRLDNLRQSADLVLHNSSASLIKSAVQRIEQEQVIEEERGNDQQEFIKIISEHNDRSFGENLDDSPQKVLVINAQNSRERPGEMAQVQMEGGDIENLRRNPYIDFSTTEKSNKGSIIGNN